MQPKELAGIKAVHSTGYAVSAGSHHDGGFVTVITFEDGQVWEVFQPFGLMERSWECVFTPGRKDEEVDRYINDLLNAHGRDHVEGLMRECFDASFVDIVKDGSIRAEIESGDVRWLDRRKIAEFVEWHNRTTV